MSIVPNVSVSKMVLILLPMLVIFAGLGGPWLDYPLSGSVKGFQIDVSLFSVTLPIIEMYVVCIAFFAIAYLYNKIWLAIIVLFVSIALLLSVPLEQAFGQYSSIDLYVQDSVIRRDLQRFFNASFIPNSIDEPSMVLINSYESLQDRLAIAWQMLSWGFILSFIATISLLFVLISNLDKQINIFKILGLFVIIQLSVFVGVSYKAFYAEYLYVDAVNRLKSAEYDKANQLLVSALSADPIRSESTAFMERFVESYYWTHNKDLPISRLFTAKHKVSKRLQSSSDEAIQIYGDIIKSDFGDNQYSDEALAFARKCYSELCINNGLLKYNDKKIEEAKYLWSNATQAYNVYWHAVFMSAKTAADLHDYDSCINLITGLIEKTSKHSIVADMYSTIGDCYVGKGDYEKAREAYTLSNKLDPNSNYRALKELGGT